MAALFAGRTDVIGTNRGGVKRQTVTVDDYAHHVYAERAIGIFPVRDDNTVLFGAIDLDEPDFDLARQMQEFIPGTSWIEKSRSGNAHIWVFFDAPLECWAAKKVLREVTLAVGHPGVEVFPKQDELKPGMVGNYINLPWFGDKRPILAYDDQGRANVWNPAAWMDAAETNRCSADQWRERAISLGGGPPARKEVSDFGSRGKVHLCGQYMREHQHDNPLQPGHRAVVLFNLAKMYSNVENFTPEEVLQIVEEFNEAGVEPVPPPEVERFCANAERGEFTSTGCDDPLMADYVHPDCPIANA